MLARSAGHVVTRPGWERRRPGAARRGLTRAGWCWPSRRSLWSLLKAW